MDRRYLRTEKQLVEAMLALIKERPFHTITIEDIVNRADIARKTFYAHYENKEQLLWNSLLTHFQATAAETSSLDPDSLLMDGKPLSYPIFLHVHEYAAFYKGMLNETGDLRFLLNMWDYIAAQSYAKHEQLREAAPFISVPPDLIAHILAAALLGALRWWLNNGLQESPEQMAYRFSQILAPGVLQAMGFDSAP